MSMNLRSKRRRELLGAIGVGLLGVGAQQPGAASDAFFRVRISSAPDSVEAGESISVSVDVENRGDSTDTQLIRFDQDFPDDSEEVTLDPDESTSVSLTKETSRSDIGSLSIRVTSDDSSNGTSVDVLEPGELHPTVVGTNSPVVAGIEEFEIDIEVENVGETSASNTVEYEIQPVGSSNIPYDGDTSASLSGGETDEFTVSLETEHRYSARNVFARARIDGRSSSEEGRIIPPEEAEFAVESVDVEAVPAGDELTITTTVHNVNHETAEKDVECQFNTEQQTKEVELEWDEEQELEFVFETAVDEYGEHTVTIETPDDSESVTVEVLQLPTYIIESVTVPNSVPQDESFDVEVTVRNDGDISDSEEITLARERTPADGDGDDSSEDDGDDADYIVLEESSVTVEVDETETVSLTAPAQRNQLGNTEFVIQTEADSTTETIAIVPAYEIEELTAPDEVAAGEEISVETTVTNVGEIPAEATMTAELGDTDTDTVSEVALESGETTTVAFELTAETDAYEDHTLLISVIGSDDEGVTAAEQTVAVRDSSEADVGSDGGGSSGGSGGSDEEGTGFGVGAGVAGGATLAYLLKRKTSISEDSGLDGTE